MSCDVETLRGVVDYFERNRVETWVFGGRTEELRGIEPPSVHSDVDLLSPGNNFSVVDEVLCTRELDEITSKHFSHKRALLFAGVMVEIFLITHDHQGWYTRFWDRVRHDWPSDVLATLAGQRVASTAALQSYRAAQGEHDLVHQCVGPTYARHDALGNRTGESRRIRR